MRRLPSMTKSVKGKLDIKSKKTKKTWNMAIREAERHLVLAKRRVDGLEKTVANWTRLRDEGIPWPSDQENAK
jgi:hypothetical protein